MEDVCKPVSTGENAVKKTESDKPDGALTGLHVVGKTDGIQAAREICDKYDIPLSEKTPLISDMSKNKQRIVMRMGILFLCFFCFLSSSYADQTITAGVYNFAPLVSVDERGETKGFFIDILNHIARKEAWRIDYVPGSWNDCLSRLKNGEVDLLVSIAYSEERARGFDFTKTSLFVLWGEIYKKKGSPIETIFDLEGKRVSVLRKALANAEFAALLDQFGVICQILEQDSYAQVLQSLMHHEADAGIFTNIYGMQMLGDHDIERTQIIFAPTKVRFAVKKHHRQDILLTLEEHFSALKTDKQSVYYELYDKWLRGYKEKTIVPECLIWALSLLLVCSLFLLSLNLILKRQVARKTSELVLANQELCSREEKIQASLNEKEILLRELYHRTKNNMQVISSMLTLQAAMTPKNSEVRKLVKDTENRILTMSLVHQKLYQSRDLSLLDIREYIDDLAHLIIRSYGISPQRITLVSEIESIALLLDTAIPCGLLLNELLSNALEHAFPGDRDGEISVRLFRNDDELLELQVSDNGVGVPKDFDFGGQKTLGLRTIFSIAEHQMQGRVTFTGNPGVTCIIEFSDTLYAERV